MGSLSSLKDLTIEECSNLASLPEGMGSLSSLKDLTIQGCSNLASLPEGIGSLSSLTDLTSRRDGQPLITFRSYN
ncbi:hypothetical protein TIFTF001_037239 [Ficus carica]|uniref:Uncharacterized protein n=1 Tax=Ficus carica TaxID=3494 RepID=A0AA88E8D1_FICCA|nr:hypothetical protein TIFTF001_037217 [Ficus carica]GMN68170.1 hypothetical protein TIFTF001_037226 [Ficus carica]GMN68171.1 hypothetical protein TIFTF001_037229 [Ficus carica]GMN68182.1 hypothetical protein TIFTF001_037239 [Ficus carica]